jgi:hypothetical protein
LSIAIENRFPPAPARPALTSNRSGKLRPWLPVVYLALMA